MNKLLGMNIKKEMLWITVCIPMIIMFPCINNKNIIRCISDYNDCTILFPCINKKGKKTFILANIIYLIFSILIYANYVYYNYSTNFLSVFQIENIKYAEEIGMSLQYLINLKSLFTFFIDNIILGILSVVILKKRKKDKLILIKK